MFEMNENCKCNLKYKQLSVIDSNLISQLKLVFISEKYEFSDVIFITTDDEVYGYGSNNNGRLGLGHNKPVQNPTVIPELCARQVINVEFGVNFVVALTKSMHIYTQGFEDNGVLGNGNDSCIYRKPNKIDLNGKLVIDMKCCVLSTYLLTLTNEIYYFGNRTYFKQSAMRPQFVNTLISQKITAISCGFDHTLALTDTGKVYSWGFNNYGQLGLGQNAGETTLPQLIQSVDIFIKKIASGKHHNLLLSTDGDIYSFGCNEFGQLGTGDQNNLLFPKLIDSKTKFTEIYAFENSSMAMNQLNSVTIWGKATVTSPFNTNMNCFQEVILAFSPKPFSYKPLTRKQLFIESPVNRLVKTMAKIFNNPKNSDFKFKVKRKGSEEFDYIYGHKWFVEENSEHFERMFANNWSENERNEIEIKGYSYESYYQFIRYLYTDCIETQDIEVLIEMLSISDEYLDEEFKKKCIQTIKPLNNIENVCSLYCVALRTRSKELEDFCFKIMIRNIKLFIVTEDYKRMDSNCLKHFFTEYIKQLP